MNIATAQENGTVKKQITQLTNSLENEKQQSDKLRLEIKTMEKKLGNITNNRFQTEKKIKAINYKLQASLKKKRLLQQEVKQQREALAQQLQALYSAGEQSHLRLLLRQDDPSEISRTIKYFEYFNTARVKKIQAAQITLGKLKQVEASIHEKQIKQKEWIKQLAKQTKEVKQLLAQRSRYLNKLKGKISSKEKRLERLLAQEAKLQIIVDQVTKKVIKPVKVPPQRATTSSVNQAKGKQVTTHRVPNKPLTQLKGKLSWPIRGEMLHSYGQKRNGHQKWQAVVLAASGGTKVKAIAKGEVIFAEWMEGFGHLIIIQHDKNYLSLYGYNRSLYKKEGSQVKAGEVIAAVGNSGGQSRDALYFEIRKGRVPQNPSLWCK
jgi:septal ring factor EnvC (AmiA/AmiB activator)